jgi:ribose transport system ATP-binding protein
MGIIEMRSINKSFPGVKALDNVDFSVEEGEIHALLGENGAGKSTLMNILAGVYPMDSGMVLFDGKPLKNASVRLTESLGIAFVHQELNLFNDLKVYENFYFNKELTNTVGTLKKREMIAEAERMLELFGVHIDVMELVGNLKASEKQMLEIAKAIFFEARLLILDEPTTALNTNEVEHLFNILNNLKNEGKSFIFISHKMPEIFEIADRYTVLRNGKLVGSGKIKDITPLEVTKMMVGESYDVGSVYTPRELGEVVLELSEYSGEAIKNVNLTVRKGEVIGLTGLQGSGSSELLWMIFGALPSSGGTLKIHGKEINKNSIHKAMGMGVSLLPSERQENSVIGDATILENVYLSEHQLSSRKQHIFRKKEMARYENLREKLSIRAKSCDDPVVSLSGGNQQKVFFARWLNTGADIMLLDNPTQGIDVGSKAEIYRLIIKMAEEGKTILINTLEIPELLTVVDRCAVFYQGEITKVLPHYDISEHTVMTYATSAFETKEGNNNAGN